MASIGDRVRQARQAAGFTQPELAKKVGVSKASVSFWETGETKNLAGRHLYSLANVLNVAPEWLITGREIQIAGLKHRGHHVALEQFSTLDDGGKITVSGSPAPVAYSRDWLERHNLTPEQVVVIEARDDAMAPTFIRGELVGVDTSAHRIEDAGCYVFLVANQPKIRRFSWRVDGTVLMTADSGDTHYPDEILAPDQLENLQLVGHASLRLGGKVA